MVVVRGEAQEARGVFKFERSARKENERVMKQRNSRTTETSGTAKSSRKENERVLKQRNSHTTETSGTALYVDAKSCPGLGVRHFVFRDVT